MYYVYGPSAFTALTYAISLNFAPIISISYYTCEGDASPWFYRSALQQANAQGITVLSASGDGGGAGCFDQFGYFATHGPLLQFPGVLPEVTAVGGTMFVEGTGTYWTATNSDNLGSALSYIPEKVWNESSPGVNIAASGGGPSSVYAKPLWQSGPGVPSDGARDVPDVALTAAGHDPYYVVQGGRLVATYGTSAAAPAMAGILALVE
jgi:subtilase family serine protease